MCIQVWGDKHVTRISLNECLTQPSIGIEEGLYAALRPQPVTGASFKLVTATIANVYSLLAVRYFAEGRDGFPQKRQALATLAARS